MNVPKAQKLPSGTWRIRMLLGGKNVYVTGRTAKDVTHKAELIKAKHRAEKKKEKAAPITIKDACEKYIAERDGVISQSTIRGYTQIKDNRFRGIMGLPLDAEINWQSVVNSESKLEIKGKTISPKTVYNAYAFMKSVFGANKIAIPTVTMSQIVTAERPYLDWEQIPVFLRGIKGKACEKAALYALHGLRKSELLAVEKVENGFIYVHGAVVLGEDNRLVRKETNKNTTSNRIVPIMIPRLADLIAADGPIVKQYPTGIYKQINTVCRQNNLPEVGIHGLRHSFASLAYHLGMSELEAMELGGWADRNTMHKIYTHLAATDKAKAVNKMSAFYAGEKTADSVENFRGEF